MSSGISAGFMLDRQWHWLRGEMETTKKPTLLICPTSVIGNWEKEAERFTPGLPLLVHHGSGRAKAALKDVKRARYPATEASTPRGRAKREPVSA